MPFATIAGHTAVLGVLRRAVARDRVPQSLLFAGPEGVGKHAVALALAQALNCPVRRAAGGDDACGTCPTCQRIGRGVHSDVVSIDRGEDSQIKLKYLRERVLEVVGYRPFEAHRRVFIIDADDLAPDGQDALLKTLEEPPASAVLILMAARPDALSPTVLSRCRRLRFGPLSEQDVARILIDRLAFDPKAARGLSAASGGSVTHAMAEREGDLADDRQAALDVLTAAARNRVVDQLKASAALAKHDSDRRDREALGVRLELMRSMVRDLGAAAVRARSPAVNTDLAHELASLAGAFDARRSVRAYAAIGEAIRALDRNASPKIVADWVTLNL
jgi:DNA polymerase-3 subunit delta'